MFLHDWRDEEPGKLLHQARRGPVSVLGLDPFTAYYGDWATGPDFLVFLGQYWAWTADITTVRELLPVARQVLHWLDRYGDLDQDGFLEYHCRSTAGVKNQGWKDSGNAIIDQDGQVIENPIATSELQAYWYAALRHGALAFAAGGDRAFAAQLIAKAAQLRRRFHATYWMPDQRCYAMALGPDKKQVRSVNSNDGHLLAAGIVPSRLARTVAHRLMAEPGRPVPSSPSCRRSSRFGRPHPYARSCSTRTSLTGFPTCSSSASSSATRPSTSPSAAGAAAAHPSEPAATASPSSGSRQCRRDLPGSTAVDFE